MRGVRRENSCAVLWGDLSCEERLIDDKTLVNYDENACGHDHRVRSSENGGVFSMLSSGRMEAEYEGQLLFLEPSAASGLQSTAEPFFFLEDFLLFFPVNPAVRESGLAGGADTEINGGVISGDPIQSPSSSSSQMFSLTDGVISVNKASRVADIRPSSSSGRITSPMAGALRDSDRSERYQSSVAGAEQNLRVYEQRPLHPLEISSTARSCPRRTQQLRNHSIPFGSSGFFPQTMKLSDGLT